MISRGALDGSHYLSRKSERLPGVGEGEGSGAHLLGPAKGHRQEASRDGPPGACARWARAMRSHPLRTTQPLPRGTPAQVQALSRDSLADASPSSSWRLRARRSARDQVTEVTLRELLPFRWPSLALSLLEGPQPNARRTCHISSFPLRTRTAFIDDFHPPESLSPGRTALRRTEPAKTPPTPPAHRPETAKGPSR